MMKHSKTPTRRPGRKPQSKPSTPLPAPESVSTEVRWTLRLYVAGQTRRSLTAFANLKQFCDEFLTARYEIEVVDLLKRPELAERDQIVALPTLVRKLPEPIKRIVGDLSNTQRVIVGMDLKHFAVR